MLAPSRTPKASCMYVRNSTATVTATMNILQALNIAQIVVGVAYALYSACRTYIQIERMMRGESN